MLLLLFFNPAKACTSQQGSFPPWALHCSLLFYNATKNTWLDFHSVLRRRKTQRKRKACLFFLYSNLQIIIVCKKNQSLNTSAENISPLEWYEFKKQGLVGVLNFSGCYYCMSNCLVLCNLPAELEILFFFFFGTCLCENEVLTIINLIYDGGFFIGVSWHCPPAELKVVSCDFAVSNSYSNTKRCWNHL